MASSTRASAGRRCSSSPSRSALVTLALIWADLGETNLAPSASFAAQLRAYPDLFRSRRFWGYSATATLASGAFFAFLGGGPWVASEVLGMSPSQLGFHFGFIAVGYMVGNFVSGRYAGAGRDQPHDAGGRDRRHRRDRARDGALRSPGWSIRSTFFGSILFVGLGNGLLLPSANAGIVSVRPHLAGSASGLGGALVIGGGALLSVVAGAAARARTPARGRCSWIMLASSALGVVSTLDVMRLARAP